MARRSVELVGVDELRKALERADKRALNAAADAVGEELNAIRDDMRRDVPIDTGELRGSIVARPGGLSGEVRATARHAEFVERGTSDTPARPYAEPAAEVARKRAPARLRDAIRKAIA